MNTNIRITIFLVNNAHGESCIFSCAILAVFSDKIFFEFDDIKCAYENQEDIATDLGLILSAIEKHIYK